ncbi:MAG TPA: hypothetical protein VMM36_02145 [Opitutaceae bacterium]|nr:hypothetical protein [Opitutaceae bacterium]
MDQAAMFTLFSTVQEVPFPARRETSSERFQMLQLIRRTVPSKFRAPPLPAVFGPGTKMPKGAVVARPPRKSKKR